MEVEMKTTFFIAIVIMYGDLFFAKTNVLEEKMFNRILSIALGGLLCLLTFYTNCSAADKVVVIPLNKSMFQGDQYHTIPSVAFTATNQDSTYYRVFDMFWFLGYLQLPYGISAFAAPVILPDGVIISELSTYIKEAGTANCKMYFTRHTLSNNQIQFINTATDSSSLTPGQLEPIHVDIANEVIDNQYNQYLLSWTCSGGEGDIADQLFAARIKYRFQ